MSVPIKKLRRQLHVSGIQMLNGCGVQFMFRYELGIKLPPRSFIHKGTATHSTVEQDLGVKMTTGELMKATDVQDYAAEAFDSAQRKEPIELAADEIAEGKTLQQVIDETRAEAQLLALLHHDKVAPSIEPIALSKKFSVKMDAFLKLRAKEMRAEADQIKERDRSQAKMLDAVATSLNSFARDGIDFAGEWDIVEEKIAVRAALRKRIRDTKTTGKSPSNPSAEDKARGATSAADDSEQLSGYALAHHVEYGTLPDDLVLDYLVITPKKKDTKYVPLYTTRDLDDVGVFLNRFVNAIHSIKTGVFVPAKADDWRCSQKWCGYFDRCPYAKKPKLIQITSSI